jgi:toxin CptA
MSIAVSVPLAPSRLLLSLQLAFAALCLVMAGAAAAGRLGPLWAPALTVGACLLAAAATAAVPLRTTSRPTARALDVLGPGSLVLTVQQGDGEARRLAVRLLADSTLWPGLLVLRFDVAPALVLLPDSLPPGQFRRLAMALRAVAARPADPA